MKIYTKTGDAGTTSLAFGQRVGKDDLRVEAYGTVDELSAFIAYFRDNMDPVRTFLDEYRDDLGVILNTLMTVQALLASGGSSQSKVEDISEDEISYLEKRIDYISEQLTPLTRFTIPGGHPLVSLAHICRTVCRRAERESVRAAGSYEISANSLAYLNRLSDYLYQLGRKMADELSVREEFWEPEYKA
ncbi:MAG: cob(I)yrinic acid a,c-diamide adenosyltransferase [Rikenellaceae bacterium]|nr:cob(I)yrinic acid a,c-diamide adenosyltransferase [Rikenellaceae bacterium]